jgi:hypothetical protein
MAPAKTLPKLYCSKCGAKAEATCDCAVPYVSAGVAAAKGVAAYWDLSDRAIGKKIGVSYSTVREARLKLTTGGNPSVDERRRIGLDGRSRLLPRHGGAITPADVARLPRTFQLVEQLTPIMNALKKEGNKHVMAMSPDNVARLAYDLRTVIDEALSPISRAKACEVCALEWTIDGTKSNKDVINAVREAAHAWSDLLTRLLAATSSATLPEDDPVKAAAGRAEPKAKVLN